MGSGEQDKIARLAARFAGAPRGVLVAIGDDAAVLDPVRLGQAQPPDESRRLVWTIDEHVEGTHFRRELVPWADEGWRSFMAAASDLAAMGAEPWCALSALVLPAAFDDDALDDLSEGQQQAAQAVRAPVVGGNLARGNAVSIATTLLGTAVRPIERRGAVPGDRVLLAGPVGLARAGLLALDRRRSDARLRAAVQAWLRPRARIEDGLAAARAGAHAGIDVSDGLARDLGHVAAASGVAIVVDEAKLRTHAGEALERAADALATDALDLALYGGEDYALVAACPGPIDGFVEIGHVEEGTGLTLAMTCGTRPIDPHGFDHFG